MKAHLAKDIDRVIDKSSYRHENDQDFAESPSTLGDLNEYLRVIWEELTEYKVWPVSRVFFNLS
jgi:hypothetical protein